MKINIVPHSAELLTSKESLLEQLKLCELAGRTCYKTEDKITDDSAGKFIRGIVERGHESVIEHGHIVFKFIGSRSMSHQLVRHRLCEYSQESQRYCDYGKKGFTIICPPDVATNAVGIYYCKPTAADSWFDEKDFIVPNKRLERWLNNAMSDYNEYLYWKANGLKNDDAREVLPNTTKTEVMITANFRQWRHMIKHRGLNPRAQWQIRENFLSARDQLVEILPDIFGDLYVEKED